MEQQVQDADQRYQAIVTKAYREANSMLERPRQQCNAMLWESQQKTGRTNQ